MIDFDNFCIHEIGMSCREKLLREHIKVSSISYVIDLMVKKDICSHSREGVALGRLLF